MYPKILEFGPITVHTYGLLLAAAFIAGIWITSRNARKNGMNADSIWNMGLLIIFSALVGSKILLFFSEYGYYSQHLREIFSLSTLRSSGVYYGGLLLALGSAVLYVKKSRFLFGQRRICPCPALRLGRLSPAWDAYRQAAAMGSSHKCPGASDSQANMPMTT